MSSQMVALPAGQDANLGTQVTGIEEGTPVKFTIYRVADDSLISEVDGMVDHGRAICFWPAEGPDPEAEGAERECRIYFKAIPDGSGMEITSPEMVVYLDYIDVETVTEDGQVAPDVPVRVKVGAGSTQTVIERSTSTDGKVRVDNLPRGEIALEWAAPIRFMDWTHPVKAARFEATVRPAFEVQITWPTGEAEEGQPEPPETGEDGQKLHCQWVNLQPAQEAPSQGERIRVKVKLKESYGPGAEGDEIFARLEYPPATELSAREGRRGFPGEDATKTSLTLREEGGEAVFEVDLGLAGGDRVTIHVGGTEACEDDSITIVNWRRLWQKTIRPTCAEPPAERTTFEEHTRSVNVVVEALDETTFSKADLDDAGQHAWLSGADFSGRADDPRDYWILGDHNASFARDRFDDSRGPLGVNVVVPSALYDCGVDRPPRFVQRLTCDSTNYQVSAEDGEFFMKHPRSGEPPLARGTWTSLAPEGHPDHGKSGELNPEWARVDRSNAARRGILDCWLPEGELPGSIVGSGEAAPGQVPEAVKHPLQIVVTVLYAKGPLLELTHPETSELTAVRAPGDKSFQDALAHGLGHKMNQAVAVDPSAPRNEPPAGLKLADHGETYTGHGHFGPHCFHGLDRQASHVARANADGTFGRPDALAKPGPEEADFRSLYVDQQGTAAYGVCVMYGAHPGEDPQRVTTGYCEGCQKMIKAQPLQRLF